MKPTDSFIRSLQSQKSGELSKLRFLSNRRLDESQEGFDIFSGVWWPLRSASERTPRREVAWLICKLHSYRSIEHYKSAELAVQLAKCIPNDERKQPAFRRRFDELLTSRLDSIEHHLRWAINELHKNGKKLDWVSLTDDLSTWERESTRLEWAKQFLDNQIGGKTC